MKGTGVIPFAYSETNEQKRLNTAREACVPWKKWGPYLSERQWGTVREDYSHDGNAWNYFSHDQARSRVYRWGEDGLAGSDDQQQLCFAIARWSSRDPILKELLFGLTNCEGNHGEDVKEYYSYLDSTPTHSYMKYLYKYPQWEFPYVDLVDPNKHRSRQEFEYELIDTGVFEDDRYFDVFVEYAKGDLEDLLIQMTVHNRGPVWMPVNVLNIRSLLHLYQFYGDEFKVECPKGSGADMTLFEVAKEIGRRLSSIFLRDAEGRRPVYGGTKKFQEDPHWTDYILFYDYFHGDNGAGLRANHQTG